MIFLGRQRDEIHYGIYTERVTESERMRVVISTTVLLTKNKYGGSNHTMYNPCNNSKTFSKYIGG